MSNNACATRVGVHGYIVMACAQSVRGSHNDTTLVGRRVVPSSMPCRHGVTAAVRLVSVVCVCERIHSQLSNTCMCAQPATVTTHSLRTRAHPPRPSHDRLTLTIVVICTRQTCTRAHPLPRLPMLCKNTQSRRRCRRGAKYICDVLLQCACALRAHPRSSTVLRLVNEHCTGLHSEMYAVRSMCTGTD